MNNNINGVILTAIRNLYREDECAHAFFDWAASRKNDAAETSVDRMSQVTGITRGEAVSLAKSLADAGCGEYLVGRKGGKTRVRWSFSLRSLGEAAAGRIGALKQVDLDLVDDVSDQAASAGTAESAPEQMRFTIAEAKKRLAESLGVSPEAIEITIRG